MNLFSNDDVRTIVGTILFILSLFSCFACVVCCIIKKDKIEKAQKTKYGNINIVHPYP